ncbi:serine/threonine-protein kinase [Streptomyces sp. NPDC051976]|uniref:serine/threonine-protein kinase n=1 Tax=Streptomyces sp. NPDC051976 TaxID=3154947 RepID=UPI00341B5A23
MGVQHTGPVFQRPVFQPLTPDDPVALSAYRISARLGAPGVGPKVADTAADTAAAPPPTRVYLAHAPGGLPVALRVIGPELAAAEGFTGRFAHETQALRRVHGPYTVPVVDSGTDGERPWLASAYVPGLALDEAVGTAGPLPVPSVLRLVAGIAEALRTIHHAGVVHGGLAPAQVLLAADGPRVKDYGLASLLSAVPGGGAPGGDAPVFLAPEQAAGRPSGPPTDVFALGQIAAYASIGAAPFGGGPLDTVRSRVQQEEPDLSELPGELREIVTRCLIKDPALRPSPAQIIAMCAQAAPDASRRRADRWLPPALLAAIVPAMPPPAPPVPPVPPLPGQHPGALHYGWARPGVPHAPRHLPVHLPLHRPLHRPHVGRRAPGVVAAIGVLAVVVTAGFALAGGFGDSGTRPGAGNDKAVGARPTATAPADGPGGTAPGPSTDPTGSTGPAAPTDPGDPSATVTLSPDPTGIPGSAPGSVYPAIRLPAGYGLSLAETPPVVRPGTFSGVFGFTPEADAFATDVNRGTLALLEPGRPGTLAACRAAAREQASVPRKSVSAGSRICVRAMDGTTALVTFRALATPGAPAQSATLDVTVWRTASESVEADQ